MVLLRIRSMNLSRAFWNSFSIRRTLFFSDGLDTSLDVNSDVYDALFDDCNVEDYYTSWQVLFAAEVADAGSI